MKSLNIRFHEKHRVFSENRVFMANHVFTVNLVYTENHVYTENRFLQKIAFSRKIVFSQKITFSRKILLHEKWRFSRENHVFWRKSRFTDNHGFTNFYLVLTLSMPIWIWLSISSSKNRLSINFAKVSAGPISNSISDSSELSVLAWSSSSEKVEKLREIGKYTFSRRFAFSRIFLDFYLNRPKPQHRFSSRAKVRWKTEFCWLHLSWFCFEWS